MTAIGARRATAIVSVLVVLFGFGLVATPAQAATGWTHDGHGVWRLDKDRDGRPEETRVDRNRDNIVESIAYDTNDDGRMDWFNTNLYGGSYRETWVNPFQHRGVLIYTDLNENGRYEYAAYDLNRDRIYDFEYLDTNRDGHADEWFVMSGFNNSRSNDANLDRYLNNFTSRMRNQNFSMINP